MSVARKARVVSMILVALLLLIQLVPYGRDHENPPDGTVVAFDSPATEQLAKRACFDCHSNHTRWPWYASIAPISWRLQNHVDEGREHLNLTAFEATNRKMTHAAGEAGETVTEGEMPPWDYLLVHPEARLTEAEKTTLQRGLDSTFATFVRERAARRAARSQGARP